jgi:hypothetical protein
VDPFYDALEDLLHDLRTVTMVSHLVPDNRRAFDLFRLSRITTMPTPLSSPYPERMYRIIMTVRFRCLDANLQMLTAPPSHNEPHGLPDNGQES